MTVTVYKSTDANAPVLSGTPGSLVALLNAVLVDGYVGKAAAGWTKPYTGLNGAVYRNSIIDGTGFYLNVDDNGCSPLNGAREARVRGFEVKTGYDIGVQQSLGAGPFPTITQVLTGIVIVKSRSLDSTARRWICVADQRTFYLFTWPGEWQGYSAFMFGDFYSLTADAYRCAIIGRAVEGILETSETLSVLHASSAVGVGHYTARTIITDLTLASSVQFGKHGNASYSATGLTGPFVYPNPVNASFMAYPVTIHELAPTSATVAIRGRLRGFWHWAHPIVKSDWDPLTGVGIFNGKTFIVIRPTADRTGLYLLETSDTWETN